MEMANIGRRVAKHDVGGRLAVLAMYEMLKIYNMTDSRCPTIFRYL